MTVKIEAEDFLVSKEAVMIVEDSYFAYSVQVMALESLQEDLAPHMLEMAF